jgi:hypothetical protein
MPFVAQAKEKCNQARGLLFFFRQGRRNDTGVEKRQRKIETENIRAKQE